MAKIRVYELARDLNVETKLLLNTIKSIGINVANHQSSLSDDDVTKIQRAISGESIASPTKPAEAASRSTTINRGGASGGAAKGGEVRVIRRRRAEAEPEATAGGGVDGESTLDTQASDTASDTSATVETVGSSTTAFKSSDTSAATQAPTSAVTAPTSSGTSPEPVGGSNAQAFLDRPKKRIQNVGATIVRKASPEEIEQRRADRDREQQSSIKRRFSKEDSRGTKYTGIGTLEDTAKRASGIDVTSAPAAEKTGLRRQKSKKREDEVAEEEELKRPVVKKGKEDPGIVNTRLLLSEILPEEEEAELEVVVAPVEDEAVATRTVYTPSVAQRRRDLKRRKDLKKTEITTARAAYRVVEMGSEITVGDLAKQLKIKAGELIKKLMDQGIMVTINQNVDFDTASLLAQDYGYQVKNVSVSAENVLEASKTETKDLVERPPIVTVMGHVDHGKTSILDAIRKTDVAAGEAGGITQHIGAYSVTYNDRKIAFLDTPGHEAFSSMRARGANVTDIVVLVVAADDGIMPQTIEAISHAKAAGVPIIVAINKIDKETKDLNRIFSQLTEYGIQSEEWGGENQFVKVSATKRIGIEELLDAILLQAEVLELKASVSGDATGVVVEAHLEQGRGPIATVMVQTGTLRVGDYLVAGIEFGRVRAMHDHNGHSITEAPPSTPVEILGLGGVPLAGDKFNALKEEKVAREVVEMRKNEQRAKAGKSQVSSLDELLVKMKDAELPELAIIVKADTQGSVEAISDTIRKLNHEKVRNKIIHKGVGGISESDLILAETTQAVIIGFNVRASRGLDEIAEKKGIIVKYFSIIYELSDSVKALMEGKLPPVQEEVVIGKAEVRQPISVPKLGTIAGSAVIDGLIKRTSFARLIRDEIVIYNGRIASLRRFKDDVKEVKSGYECGIGIENYNDIKVGDVIEAYEIKEIRPTL